MIAPFRSRLLPISRISIGSLAFWGDSLTNLFRLQWDGARCVRGSFHSRSAMYQIKAMALLALLPLLLICPVGSLRVEQACWSLPLSWWPLAAVSVCWGSAVFLRMHGAQRISEKQAPGLFRMVRKVARQAGSSVPSLYMLPDRGANAFATGLSGKHGAIMVSTGLLELLDGEELAAVIAHEFGHLQRGDTLLMTVVATIAASLISISNFFTWSKLLGNRRRKAERRDGVASDALLWVLIAPLTALMIRLILSDSREYLADEHSARIIGDPGPLRRAVIKIDANRMRAPLTSASPATAHLFICNPLSSKRLARLFDTHPPVSKRVERLDTLARHGVAPSCIGIN